MADIPGLDNLLERVRAGLENVPDEDKELAEAVAKDAARLAERAIAQDDENLEEEIEHAVAAAASLGVAATGVVRQSLINWLAGVGAAVADELLP